MRLHCRPLLDHEWAASEGDGLPYTRASRLVSDLLVDREEPSAVAAIVADTLDRALEHRATMVDALNPFAARFGLPVGDGAALLDQLLETAGADPARHVARTG